MITILIGAVAFFVFGFLWYGPVFGKQYISLIGMTSEQVAESKSKGMKGMTKPMVISVIMAIVPASVISYLVPQLLAVSFSEFLKMIFIIWLGFVLPLQMNGYLWEKKSLKLTLFNSAANLLSFVLLSAIIYFWQ